MPLETSISLSLLVSFALIAWLLNPQRRWSHLLWLLAMSLSFLSARRQVWLLALTCLAVLAANAEALAPQKLWTILQGTKAGEQSDGKLAGPSSTLSRLARMGALLCLMAALAGAISSPALQSFQAVDANLPQGIARFVDTHDLGPRIFSDSDTASFLEWRCGEKRPLFIDISNAFPDQLAADCDDILAANARGRQLLEIAQISAVALRKPIAGEQLPPLLLFLAHQPQWSFVYVGYDGIIAVRRENKTKHR